MKIVRRLLASVALLALVLWLWSVLFPGPEKLIHKRLAAVAAAASFAANEGPLATARNAAKLAGYFGRDAQITLDILGQGQQTLNGRDEIQQAALGARRAVGSLTVEFLDLSVMLSPDKQSATVELTARGKVRGEPKHYIQEMKFMLKKSDGQWLIVRVETVKTLSRAGMGEVGRGTPCAPPAVISATNGARGVTRPTFPFLALGHRISAGLSRFG